MGVFINKFNLIDLIGEYKICQKNRRIYNIKYIIKLKIKLLPFTFYFLIFYSLF